MPKLMTETTSLEKALQDEMALKPGIYEAHITILHPLTQEQLNSVYTELLEKGVKVLEPISQTLENPSTIFVKFQKLNEPYQGIGQWQAALIPALPAILTVILVGIGIFKLPDITANLTPIILILVGGAVAVAAIAGREGVGRAIMR